jgi:arylformamidase
VYPGDTPFSQTFQMHTTHGDHLTLSSINSTVHLGAHADAPIHYSRHGADIAQRPLQLYIGLAQVIDVSNISGRIRPQHIQHTRIEAPRVLFKTGSFPDPNHWNNNFTALSAELVESLAQNKVQLVGIDTPSIDLADDKVLESHQVVNRHDMAILEGIVLENVTPGLYELIALPLKIAAADASPVRAVLIKRSST